MVYGEIMVYAVMLLVYKKIIKKNYINIYLNECFIIFKR